ncbi:MAG: class I tRNA ligase family protein, partial [Patescibacteria group bacterium]
MNEKLLKPYDPKETEGRIYKKWEESGYFNPDVCVEKGITKSDAKPFTIIMPPANANGSLHAGHGLVMTIEDIMTRYKRLRGYKTLWLPGLDHAGFETQVVYEKKLEKEGRSRFGMDKKVLYDEIMDFTMTNSANIKSQVRSMGASCDWSREKFTLDGDI